MESQGSGTRLLRAVDYPPEGPLETIVWVHACLNDTTQVQKIVGVPVDCERDH